jgi:C1A family cysteine protease
MKIILLLAFIAIALASNALKAEFQQWQAKHKINFSSQSESNYRFQVWQQSKIRIAEKNAKSAGSGVTWGLNSLSHYTPEEFKARLGYKRSGASEARNIPKLVNADVNQAPSAFDWCLSEGKCTPIKDQAQCGSCWAFATTENIESVWMIGGNAQVVLSPQEIVDCDTGASGCGGGDPAQAYPWVVQEGGMDTASSYPYTGEQGTCNFQPGAVAAKISGDNNGFGGSENQMAANLASTAPFSIIVDASSWQDYTGGILPASSCGQSLDHAVIAAGYDLNNQFWNVRNSWGAGWGENGYIRLQFGQNTCGLTTEVLTSTL